MFWTGGLTVQFGLQKLKANNIKHQFRTHLVLANVDKLVVWFI